MGDVILMPGRHTICDVKVADFKWLPDLALFCPRCRKVARVGDEPSVDKIKQYKELYFKDPCQAGQKTFSFVRTPESYTGE